jgi:hypothetical protein
VWSQEIGSVEVATKPTSEAGSGLAFTAIKDATSIPKKKSAKTDIAEIFIKFVMYIL